MLTPGSPKHRRERPKEQEHLTIRSGLRLGLALFLAAAACSAAQPKPRVHEVLFVGNSLTYYGNTPAVYAALSTANGHPASSDMIVEGGATLAQRVADGQVEQALQTGRYDTLVIQERGGDLLCSFGRDSCVESREATMALAGIARKHGVSVIMLGSYQPKPEVSKQLVAAETAASKAAGMGYAEVSETLRGLIATTPELEWFATDGMHPGRDLTLLNAMVLYQTLHGELPRARPLAVDAPIYAQDSGLDATLRAADAPPPHADTPTGTGYPATALSLILHVLAKKNPAGAGLSSADGIDQNL
ncbi:hypothetical protein [Lysobacter sp. H21R4]|uniref:hypothetical protein n=1 Tax=Lysobacter sp. H21R4 TaxID=2781021 RepID=UPI001E5A96A0|nr:hypothetical protein [Lysobacter sp. H21R4]